MVWTDVSWTLTVVAALVLIVAFIAILLSQVGRRDEPVLPRSNRRLPGNSDLSDAERRHAMRRFNDRKNRKPTTDN
jgi:hypothetical protein